MMHESFWDGFEKEAGLISGVAQVASRAHGAIAQGGGALAARAGALATKAQALPGQVAGKVRAEATKGWHIGQRKAMGVDASTYNKARAPVQVAPAGPAQRLADRKAAGMPVKHVAPEMAGPAHQPGAAAAAPAAPAPNPAAAAAPPSALQRGATQARSTIRANPLATAGAVAAGAGAAGYVAHGNDQQGMRI